VEVGTCVSSARADPRVEGSYAPGSTTSALEIAATSALPKSVQLEVQLARSPRKAVETYVFDFMAEGVRFELTSPVRGRRFSRPVHSTALPPFRRGRELLHRRGI
jgi:hypothetical protein